MVVLLAYANPMESPVRDLLSLHHRDLLADHVNAAILRKAGLGNIVFRYEQLLIL